jgi:DNA mismatch repair ATPase MutL
VNVTPDKRKVFMDHEKLLVATIKASIEYLIVLMKQNDSILAKCLTN